MALIRCKECGAQISSLAQSCPSCGCPVAYSLGQQTPLNGNAPAEQFIPPQQEPIPPAPSVPPVPATPPASGMTDKRKKGILITGICIGVAALLVGGFFLVRTLLDDGEPAVYYPPYSYQSSEKTTHPSGGNGEIPVPSGSEDVTEYTSAASEPTGPAVQLGQLEGSWTSVLMDTVIFEDSQQTAYRYDYDEKSWVIHKEQICEVTADTILFCNTAGKLSSVGYSVTNDGQQLTIDGIIYQKDTSGTSMKPYMTTKAPVFGNLFFGMTKDTALGTTSLMFNNEDTNTGDVYFKLPLVAEGQNDGFAVCSFDDLNKVEKARLFFYPYGLTEQGYETLQENILNSFTRWLGEANDHSSSYYDVYRRWSLRSAQITYSVSENYIVVSFNAVD